MSGPNFNSGRSAYRRSQHSGIPSVNFGQNLRKQHETRFLFIGYLAILKIPMHRLVKTSCVIRPIQRPVFRKFLLSKSVRRWKNCKSQFRPENDGYSIFQNVLAIAVYLCRLFLAYHHHHHSLITHQVLICKTVESK